MKPITKVCVRRAVVEDLPAVARVHVESWRTTYQGIVPQDFLDGLSTENSEQRFSGMFHNADVQSFMYVAEVDGAIVGFAIGGPERPSDGHGDEGELYAIYLLQEAQGNGIGRQLVLAVAEELKSRGMNSMTVWVLEDNLPARRFYESLGAIPVGQKDITIGGKVLGELSYRWTSLERLIEEHGRL
jgi:ribosomal protein S18 acetylase RimI-like enzyme